MQRVSEDSLAILLLTSDLIARKTKDDVLKPFTPAQWNRLVGVVKDSVYAKPSALFGASSDDLMKHLLLNRSTSERICRLLQYGATLSFELERLSGLGIWVVTRADQEYPIRLRQLLKEDSPPYLFGVGEQKNLTVRAIGVVGSRDADERGLAFAKKIARQSVAEGLAIVSGGAKGIDITAQQEALDVSGKVLSIVHSDLEKTIKQKATREAIVDGRLTILSAVHPAARFTGFNAMKRNKYIYALSSATFVVSSALQGGTWEGAVENLKHSWVPLFVRDGDNVPEGNKALLTSYQDHPLFAAFLEDAECSLVDAVKEVLGSQQTQAEKAGTKPHTASNDVYHLVLPVLKDILRVEKSLHELGEVLNVQLEQIKIWLDRAKQENVVTQSDKTPNTYMLRSVDEAASKAEQLRMF